MKIGAFTFGGGYAMIPLIQREVCDNKHWLNEDDILEVVAIAESTPGPVAINAATFVGSRTAGTLGAVCTTLGVVLPSFLIISLAMLINLGVRIEVISARLGHEKVSTTWDIYGHLYPNSQQEAVAKMDGCIKI